MSDPSNIKLKGFAGLTNLQKKPIKSNDPEWGGCMSNGEYLKYLCDYTNPMIGPFIIQAINAFCDETIKKADELIENEKKQEEEGTISLISNELWIECAKFLRKQNFYQYEEGGAS